MKIYLKAQVNIVNNDHRCNRGFPWKDNVKVKEMIATARAVLGYDILEAGICHKAGQSTEGEVSPIW